ncbi:hypothetical protein Goshw_007393, partial [Gossypium schwendimanii]|nr:hypothetical protein [Gossypium schwendimanii]
MFLSKSDEETTANRKLAKHLVQNWCRAKFNKTTSYLPEPTPCVYEVNPLTNFKPEFARRYRRSREVRERECFERIEKKMSGLKKSNKKKTLQ